MGSVQAGAVPADRPEPSPAEAVLAEAHGPSPSQRGAEESEAEVPLARKLRPWFILLLVLQVILLAIRWRMGDAHGALLMFAVCAVGVLALTAGSSGVDTVYGGYFGLMAFVSGLLDLNLAIESIVWSEWQHWHKNGMGKESFPSVVKPAIYLVCSATQLASAFVAYLLYKESEGFDDMESEEPLFATQDQARIYNSIVSHGERVVFARQQQTSSSPGRTHTKAFAGCSHKLPP